MLKWMILSFTAIGTWHSWLFVWVTISPKNNLNPVPIVQCAVVSSHNYPD